MQFFFIVPTLNLFFCAKMHKLPNRQGSLCPEATEDPFVFHVIEHNFYSDNIES